jgi:hypothetical protein
MTTRTRYFVIASLLVLAVGLGTGLVAYYTGFTTSAFSRQGGPDELQFVPSDASLVAFADVHEIMTSPLRQKLLAALPMKEDGHREFQEKTGIDIENDIDRVVVFVAPGRDTSGTLPGSAMVLARGRFDEVKIEALMREHGAQVEDYKGKRVIVADTPQGQAHMSLAFLEPGLVAVGGSPLVHTAVDLKNGGASVKSNEELMNLVRSLDNGNAWAVGRFDVLTKQAKLPQGVAERIPPITWFSASAHIDAGIRGVLRAESRDEASANDLRDVVRGFMALAKLEAGSKPEFQTLLQSLDLGGTGKTVSLSFDLPSEIFDALGALAGARQPRVRPVP